MIFHMVRKSEMGPWLDLGWIDMAQAHLEGWIILGWAKQSPAVAPFEAVTKHPDFVVVGLPSAT
jgi:hypothetical protein